MAKRVFFKVLRPFSSSSSFFCQTSNEMELSGWLLPSVSHLICYIALSTHIFLCNGQSKGQFLTGSIRQDDNYYKLISSIFYQILASAASVRSNLIHSAFDLVVLAQSYIISSRVIKKKNTKLNKESNVSKLLLKYSGRRYTRMKCAKQFVMYSISNVLCR